MIIKRILALFLIAAASISAASSIQAKDNKGVILSTVGIDEEYEILGLVSYRSSELNPDKIHTELRKQAERMDADYVIGLTYYNNAGYLYGTGTAVRLIKDKSER